MTDHDCGPLDPCPVCEAEKAAYAQGRADERAAIVRWLRAGGPAARDATRWPCDSFADEIERGDHEGKKPDQCMDCGAFIVGAHGCQGIPGDEEP